MVKTGNIQKLAIFIFYENGAFSESDRVLHVKVYVILVTM